MAASAGGTHEYVNALRTSSDRARVALYVLLVASVLVFAVNNNIREGGWPRRRLDAWYQYARQSSSSLPVPKLIARGDGERLKDLRDEYVKQFAAKAVMTTSPLPGVAIDVNDLGLIGGIALLSLMSIFIVAISREHENLYLGLYKVRLICEEEGSRCAHGGSNANLLYHALAMTQLLNSPPTLARWRKGFSIWALGRLIFLFPFLVYCEVIATEIEFNASSYIVYGVNTERVIFIEIGLATALFLLGMAAWLHTSAMAERWNRAFLRINPARRFVPQTSLWHWLRVRFWYLTAERLKRQRLTSGLIDTIEVRNETTSIGAVMVIAMITCPRDRLSNRDIREMRRALMRAGSTTAQAVCRNRVHAEFAGLRRFVTHSNELVGRTWRIVGTWCFAVRFPDRRLG